MIFELNEIEQQRLSEFVETQRQIAIYNQMKLIDKGTKRYDIFSQSWNVKVPYKEKIEYIFSASGIGNFITIRYMAAYHKVKSKDITDYDAW